MENYNIKKEKWIIAGILVCSSIIIVVGCIHLSGLEQTEEMVNKIDATRLAISDVTGGNLPPDPGPQKDATVQGIDANKNGIRDDVELAIFHQYIDQPATRAVLLQYALVLEMKTLYPLSKDTATAIAQEDSRAYDCIGSLLPRNDTDIEKIQGYRAFVEHQQFTTPERVSIQKSFDEQAGSFELQSGCDIDISLLPNL